MKQKIYELALQAGGSHYPGVGGDTLQKFADLILEECIDAVNKTDTRSITYTNFDKDRSDYIKIAAIKSIIDRFKD
jgi:hypothetical protein